MAEGTRMKDLHEAQKKLDVENNKLQEQLLLLGTQMKENQKMMFDKFEQMNATMVNMQSQMQSSSKGKAVEEDESILGAPPSNLRSDADLGRSQNYGRVRPYNDYQSNQVYNNPPPRFEFPRFDGTHPRAWVLSCNGYFKLVPSVQEHQKVTMAAMNFEGRAALWYQLFSSKNIVVTWPEFVGLISEKFEQLKEEQIIEDFHKIKMTGSYVEYVERFEELKEHIQIINGDSQPQSYYIASFYSGLPDELKSAIRTFRPKTVEAAIDLGKDQSALIEAITKKIKGGAKGALSTNNEQTFKGSNSAPQVVTNGESDFNGQIKRLTPAEMNIRREKGLCFNCDEKFAPGHKCKHKISFMILCEEEGTNDTPDGEPPDPLGMEYMEELQMTENSLLGNDGITTMRFTGECEGQKLQILVDSGSTLSFIKESTSRRLNCTLAEATPMVIRVASGQRLISDRVAAGFTWGIQGHTFTYPLRLLQNEGCDIILGGDWLKARTPVKYDYDRMIVPIRLNGRKVRLQAHTSYAQCLFISHHSLYKMVHSSSIKEIEETYLISGQKAVGKNDDKLKALLEEYDDISQEPQGLPFARGIEHQILYGNALPYLSMQPYLDTTAGEVKKFMQHLLKENLQRAQNRMRRIVDRFRIDRDFVVGQNVYLKLQLCRQNSLSPRRDLKLSSRFYSPYKMVEGVGQVAYRVDLPWDSKIHPVFHVSLLNKKFGSRSIPVSSLPEANSDGLFHFKPMAVLQTRSISRSGVVIRQFLVQSSVAGLRLRSWEEDKFLAEKFLDCYPWGQGFHEGRGNVMGMKAIEAKGLKLVELDAGEEND